MKHEENLNQHSDLVQINDFGEKYPILIHAHQLNQYYHTLLGNPFQRLKYYNSLTQQYEFHRTPGILKYIIPYYLHHGCLSTEIHCPAEILYDELVFFGFNIQIIYEIISSLITLDYYIPSGKYRRAFWHMFESKVSKKKSWIFRITTALNTIGSIITSFTLVEITNHQEESLLHKTLVIEILIFIFSIIQSMICYFIRPKFPRRTFIFLLIHCFSLLPIALFLFIWPCPSTWLYSLLVVQLAARLFRSVCLSSRAYEIMFNLTEHLEIYFQSFQSLGLIILFFALTTLAVEQVSSPVQFLINEQSNQTRHLRPLSDIIWISVNAFTALGEGTSRPLTFGGLIIEFVTCFIGVLTIPQLAQKIYTVASNTLDRQYFNAEKRKQNHLVMIEDEYGNQAIGLVTIDDQGHWNLPEILIQKDEF